MNTTAEVYLWGTRVGIIHQEPDKPYASFEYDADLTRRRREKVEEMKKEFCIFS